ncbi:unnamed protein product [Phytophthora fragariaefolia]|uniref:Unnamed protein product n=1 Tax=Phytophthora fragariaefolia TaxID=1490495 RepID=A0A9W6Y152_9STRA|nr:unnamed protein product [Phytophthora fragariaefolia]
MNKTNSSADTFDVTPMQSREVLAPRVPAVAALAAARRAPYRCTKLKWRTRDCQASQLYNLELDVMDLKQEIQRLLEYQTFLNSRILNQRDALDGYYLKTVMEYFRVFQHGYHPGATLDAVPFVMEVMDENMAIGPYFDRDVILNQWELYTKALSGLEVRFLRSHVVSGEGQTVVTAHASYKYMGTQATLEVIFPEAMRRYPRIVRKILGHIFDAEGRFIFIFDSDTHRIVSFNFELDFLQEYAPLLQDPCDLCALFQDARISDECLIGDYAYHGKKQGITVHETIDGVGAAHAEKKTAFLASTKPICLGTTTLAPRSTDSFLGQGTR